jgi:hypothetical protein
MKILVAILVVVAVVLFVLLHSLAKSESRARFINTMNDLKEAHLELQSYGTFTNHFRDASVYLYTNRLTIDGTDYQCEFALESDEFRERGLLTITTNEIFVWIDKKQGLIPLSRQRFFPPGF